ncbi:MAG: hypothetical protein FMNOHCHN_00350 [Ignavibacteriaceae bacterium]|nr:hypothetical protein [Ignavibacteriaceae bacterium]
MYGVGNLVNELYKKNYPVLWINPMPHRSLTLSIGSLSKNKIGKRVVSKLKQHLLMLRIVNDRFLVLSPIYIPLIGNRWIVKLNSWLIFLQIKLIMIILRIKPLVFITATANDVSKLILSFKKIPWVHNAGDLFHDLRNITHESRTRIYEIEKKIFNSADLVLAASNQIAMKIESMVNDKKKVISFPHGVDFNHFCKDVYNEIHLLQNLPKPIIGYFGSLTGANDQDILAEIAEEGFTLVLIGDQLYDYSRLYKYPNVHFFPAVDYRVLPDYARYFDLGIMNWKKAEWIENCNPKKTYEYLALGLPIVSVPIPQLQSELGDLIYFASNPKEFLCQIRKALQENSPTLIQRRKLRAQSVDWSLKLRVIEELIDAR